MLKEVLSLMDAGSSSFRSIAEELGIDEREVGSIIQQLVMLGHIKEVSAKDGCTSSACRNCPVRSACSKEEDDSSRLKYFVLTPKGKRVLEK
jgi:DNA-binding MarR family transcriptional regulator